MKTLTTILITAVITAIVVIIGINKINKPQSNAERAAFQNAIAYRIAMYADKVQDIKQHTADTVRYYDTVIKEVLIKGLPETKIIYDSITSSDVELTDSTICFTDPQLDSITKRIYEGEMYRVEAIAYKQITNIQDTMLVQKDSLLLSKDSVIFDQRKEIRRWKVGGVVAAGIVVVVVVLSVVGG